ncbi:MAG TPA: DUF192 domain-containing protein [Chthoniobacterales bacterium]
MSCHHARTWRRRSDDHRNAHRKYHSVSETDPGMNGFGDKEPMNDASTSQNFETIFESRRPCRLASRQIVPASSPRSPKFSSGALCRLAPLFLCLALLFAGCREEPPQSAFQLKTTTLHIGSEKVTAEIADTPSTTQIGLMYRSSMPENHGMIFVFPELRQASFWMHETKIPLDIAYLDDAGVILEIHPAKPMDETQIVSRNDNIAYALEMNLGWFFTHKIPLGTQVKGLPGFPSRNNE